MPKKEEKTSLKSLFSQFMQKSLQSLIAVVAEHADHIMDWVKSIPAIKRKIRRMLTAVILFSAGLSVMGIGISLYLAKLYPNLGNGLSHILIGLVLTLAALLYVKLNE